MFGFLQKTKTFETQKSGNISLARGQQRGQQLSEAQQEENVEEDEEEVPGSDGFASAGEEAEDLAEEGGAPGIEAGTRLQCRPPSDDENQDADIFASTDADAGTIGVVRNREEVVATGPPEDVDGVLMVPIEGGGTVDLTLFTVMAVLKAAVRFAPGSKAADVVIHAGTELVCNPRTEADDMSFADIYEEADSDYIIGSLERGQHVLATGPPVDVGGRRMVPIEPTGFVELGLMEVVSKEAVPQINVGALGWRKVKRCMRSGLLKRLDTENAQIKEQIRTGLPFLVDNSKLKAPTKGLGYRNFPNIQDKVGKENAAWGTVVLGMQIAKDWLQVGKRFLPMRMKGIVLLVPHSGVITKEHVKDFEQAIQDMNRRDIEKDRAKELPKFEELGDKLLDLQRRKAELESQIAATGGMRQQEQAGYLEALTKGSRNQKAQELERVQVLTRAAEQKDGAIKDAINRQHMDHMAIENQKRQQAEEIQRQARKKIEELNRSDEERLAAIRRQESIQREAERLKNELLREKTHEFEMVADTHVDEQIEVLIRLAGKRAADKRYEQMLEENDPDSEIVPSPDRPVRCKVIHRDGGIVREYADVSSEEVGRISFEEVLQVIDVAEDFACINAPMSGWVRLYTINDELLIERSSGLTEEQMELGVELARALAENALRKEIQDAEDEAAEENEEVIKPDAYSPLAEQQKEHWIDGAWVKGQFMNQMIGKKQQVEDQNQLLRERAVETGLELDKKRKEAVARELETKSKELQLKQKYDALRRQDDLETEGLKQAQVDEERKREVALIEKQRLLDKEAREMEARQKKMEELYREWQAMLCEDQLGQEMRQEGRQRQDRLALEKKRLARLREMEEEGRIKEAAAIKIQSAFRMRAGKASVAQLRNAKQMNQKRVDAVGWTRMQQMAEAQRMPMKTHAEWQEKRLQAAITIQKNWRGYRVRKNMNKKLTKLRERARINMKLKAIEARNNATVYNKDLVTERPSRPWDNHYVGATITTRNRDPRAMAIRKNPDLSGAGFGTHAVSGRQALEGYAGPDPSLSIQEDVAAAVHAIDERLHWAGSRRRARDLNAATSLRGEHYDTLSPSALRGAAHDVRKAVERRAHAPGQYHYGADQGSLDAGSSSESLPTDSLGMRRAEELEMKKLADKVGMRRSQVLEKQGSPERHLTASEYRGASASPRGPTRLEHESQGSVPPPQTRTRPWNLGESHAQATLQIPPLDNLQHSRTTPSSSSRTTPRHDHAADRHYDSRHEHADRSSDQRHSHAADRIHDQPSGHAWEDHTASNVLHTSSPSEDRPVSPSAMTLPRGQGHMYAERHSPRTPHDASASTVPGGSHRGAGSMGMGRMEPTSATRRVAHGRVTFEELQTEELAKARGERLDRIADSRDGRETADLRHLCGAGSVPAPKGGSMFGSPTDQPRGPSGRPTANAQRVGVDQSAGPQYAASASHAATPPCGAGSAGPPPGGRAPSNPVIGRGAPASRALPAAQHAGHAPSLTPFAENVLTSAGRMR